MVNLSNFAFCAFLQKNSDFLPFFTYNKFFYTKFLMDENSSSNNGHRIWQKCQICSKYAQKFANMAIFGNYFKAFYAYLLLLFFL